MRRPERDLGRKAIETGIAPVTLGISTKDVPKGTLAERLLRHGDGPVEEPHEVELPVPKGTLAERLLRPGVRMETLRTPF